MAFPARRIRRLALVCGLVAGVYPAALLAQDVSVRSYVAPGGEIGVGRQFSLNVEITGTQDVRRDIRIPDLSDFAQYLGNSTQSSVSTVGGRTTVTLTMVYRYQSLAEGSFEIPAFEVVAAGQTYATQPVEVTVSASPSGTSDPASGVGPDDLFITAEASSTSVLEGEPFVVEYRIWTRVDVTNFGMTSVPEPEGFWVEDVTPAGQPEIEQLIRNGTQYATAVVRRVVLVATGSGPRTVEPIGVEAQIRVRNGRDPFRDIFGRNSLFGTSSVPMTILSNPLDIEVRALPEGRPDPFSGVVGSLSVASDIDRDSIGANDAVTLTVRVTGEGNIRTVPPPVLDLPSDFEVFPPEVSEAVTATSDGLRGSKTFEYVLIPRAPGGREIPAVDFAYYDTRAGGYRTATAEALPLTVSGTVVEGPAGLLRGGVSELRQDIRFIRLGSLELRPAGGSLFRSAGFWIFALLPLAAMVGAVGMRRHQDLLAGDIAYARGRRAGRVAKKRLAEARRLAEGDDVRAFYAEVARALRGFIADRLNLAEAGLQMTDLEAALAGTGVQDRTREEVRACLEHCDRHLFAPPSADQGEKSRFLERAGALMTALDREFR
jgi:BatD DUF11 like domain